ncbi:MAG TPA: hypothetical protein VN457_05865 [Chlamydiales bacterium]|nr:hypothetical protein [Chlamydiales bacterium]
MIYSSPALETADLFNDRFESRIREAGGGKKGFERLFQLVVLGNLRYDKLTHPEARFIRASFPHHHTLEQKISNLWQQVYVAKETLLKKATDASPKEIDMVTTFINNSKRIIGRALTSLDKTNTHAVRYFKHYLLQLDLYKKSLEKLKKINALDPYDRIIHLMLGNFTKKTVGAKLKSYLVEFEKIEKIPEAGVLGGIKNRLGMNADSEYGLSKSGTLSRSVYARVYNDLHKLANDLQKTPSGSKWEKTAPILAQRLLEADCIMTTRGKEDNPYMLQSKRVVTLLKIQELIEKAKLYAKTRNFNTVDFKAAIKALGPVTIQSFQKITPKKLLNRFLLVSDTLQLSLPKLVDWKGVAKQENNPRASKPYLDLVEEIREDLAAG